MQTDQGGVTSESASWTPLDKLDRVDRNIKEATSDLAAAAGGMPPGIKLQMRIAMEHCDLGVLIPLYFSLHLAYILNQIFGQIVTARKLGSSCSWESLRMRWHTLSITAGLREKLYALIVV